MINNSWLTEATNSETSREYFASPVTANVYGRDNLSHGGKYAVNLDGHVASDARPWPTCHKLQYLQICIYMYTYIVCTCTCVCTVYTLYTMCTDAAFVCSMNCAISVLLHLHLIQVLVQSELDKISQRIDDLRKQIVTSPDKLRAVSKHIHMCM